MTLLQVADLRFGYAGDTLFEGVTFSLAQGDRVALVAPNGSGKTHAARASSARELEPDAGSVVLRREATLGFYRQSHEMSAEGDVLGAFLSGFREVVELRDELRRAQEQAASGSREALDTPLARHRPLPPRPRRRARAPASPPSPATSASPTRDLARPVASLSGGERGRLRLGVVLAQQPDVLLLDEPTNHLDLDTIAWLEELARRLPRRGARREPRSRVPRQHVPRARWSSASGASAPTRCSYSDYVVAPRGGSRARARPGRAPAGIDREDRGLHPQEHRGAEDQAGAEPAQDAREAGPAGAAGGRVGHGRTRCVPFRARRCARATSCSTPRASAPSAGGAARSRAGPARAARRAHRRRRAQRGRQDHAAAPPRRSRRSRGRRGTVKRGTNLQEGYFDQHLGDVDTEGHGGRQRSPASAATSPCEAARQYLARFRFWGDDPLRVVSGFSGGERSRLALAQAPARAAQPALPRRAHQPPRHPRGRDPRGGARRASRAPSSSSRTTAVSSRTSRRASSASGTARPRSIRGASGTTSASSAASPPRRRRPGEPATAGRRGRGPDGKGRAEDEAVDRSTRSRGRRPGPLEKKKRRIQELEAAHRRRGRRSSTRSVAS